MEQYLDGTVKNWLDDKIYPSYKGFVNSLRKFNFNTKKYYDVFFLENEKELYCENCGKEVKFYTLNPNNRKFGYKRTCSDVCFNKLPDKRQKISKRFVGNEAKKEEFVRKWKNTMSNKTNEELENISIKRIKTMKERYGQNYFSEKCFLQWKKLNNEEKKNLIKKIYNTKIKNNTLNANNCKSRFKEKNFTINNINYSFQGYEDAVIKFLVENNFEINKVPKVNFDNNKCGYYTPDIFIKSLNLLIEVKSDYTLFSDLENNKEKQKSSLQDGFNHVIFAIKKVKGNVHPRELLEEDKNILDWFLNKVILSQASLEEGAETIPLREYGAIAIGTGSAGHPSY